MELSLVLSDPVENDRHLQFDECKRLTLEFSQVSSTARWDCHCQKPFWKVIELTLRLELGGESKQ